MGQALRQGTLSLVKDRVEALLQDSIRVIVTPADDAAIITGTSKLGGRPDLPADAEWPARGGNPLSLFAQFNLAEVAPHDRQNPPAPGHALLLLRAGPGRGLGV